MVGGGASKAVPLGGNGPIAEASEADPRGQSGIDLVEDPDRRPGHRVTGRGAWLSTLQELHVQLRLEVLQVLPTRAMGWPAVTFSPARTRAEPLCRCAYAAKVPSSWAMMIRLPEMAWIPPRERPTASIVIMKMSAGQVLRQLWSR